MELFKEWVITIGPYEIAWQNWISQDMMHVFSDHLWRFIFVDLSVAQFVFFNFSF